MVVGDLCHFTLRSPFVYKLPSNRSTIFFFGSLQSHKRNGSHGSRWITVHNTTPIVSPLGSLGRHNVVPRFDKVLETFLLEFTQGNFVTPNYLRVRLLRIILIQKHLSFHHLGCCGSHVFRNTIVLFGCTAYQCWICSHVHRELAVVGQHTSVSQKVIERKRRIIGHPPSARGSHSEPAPVGCNALLGQHFRVDQHFHKGIVLRQSKCVLWGQDSRFPSHVIPSLLPILNQIHCIILRIELCRLFPICIYHGTISTLQSSSELMFICSDDFCRNSRSTVFRCTIVF
mmetsp:Transcript_22708/g.33680  ORF Transcript_22708/g.33680 Transcript_22708/m.33680 type:complete len:286 (+) Transcript_22708:55-912(+)